MRTYTLQVHDPGGKLLVTTQRSTISDTAMWVRDELLARPYVTEGCTVTVTVEPRPVTVTDEHRSGDCGEQDCNGGAYGNGLPS